MQTVFAFYFTLCIQLSAIGLYFIEREKKRNRSDTVVVVVGNIVHQSFHFADSFHKL